MGNNTIEKDEANVEEKQEQMTAAEAAAAAEAAVNAKTTEKAEEVEEPTNASADEQFRAALEEKENRYLRLQADFENFRRRTRQEKEELGDVVTQNLLRDMLPLLDNFERALVAEQKDAAAFRTGVEMIYKQLSETLKKNGLAYIETAGQKFDPVYHQAVMRVQDEAQEDDTIVMEMQKGYTARGKVIRPSMVQVVAN